MAMPTRSACFSLLISAMVAQFLLTMAQQALSPE
jgi:hypothetical protein